MTTDLTTTQPQALAESLAQLVAEWMEHERQEGRSETTLQAYRRGLDSFTAWLLDQDQAAGTVGPQLVRQFKADLAEQYSPQTVNLRLSAVRSFYRFCVETGRLATSPAAAVRGVKRPSSKTHKRDALANGEVLAVLQTCDLGTLAGVRDRAILSLLAFCGLRSVEIRRANLGNLKTQVDRLVLEVWGKGRLEADELVVIPHQEEPAIRAWLSHRRTFRDHGPGDPLFVSLSNQSRGQRLALRSIRGMVRRRYDAAGVAGARKSTHSLRHSAITNAIRRGASPLQVQAMARHGSFDTTMTYYHEVSRLDDPAEDLIDYGRG